MNNTPLFSKVLLLEDDESHAFLIRRALKGIVDEVLLHTSLGRALEALPEFEGDLVISDLNLPDSRETLHIEQMKQLRPDLPIMVLTSSTSLEDAVTAMKSGAHDFLVKNFDSDFKEVLQLSLSRLFTSLELEREKLKFQREMNVLRVAIENSSDAMAVVEGSGEVRYCNRAFSSFAARCGGSPTRVTDMFSDAVKRKSELEREIATALSTLERGGVWKSEIIFSDDPDAAFDIGVSSLTGEFGAESRDSERSFVVWVRDISEAKRREKFQREIISTTTHDLKGPLGAILISCELLTPLVEDKQRAKDLVLRVESSARNSLNIIDEFLSARRIEEGTFILRPSEQDIAQIIEEVLADYRAITLARSQTLSFTHPQSRVLAKIDRLGFARVLGNLLSNAVKFTPKEGAIEVSLEARPDEFQVAVKDSGSGLDAAEVQRVFDRFSRLERHSGIKGSGIGLYVVRSIVTAHGGRIDVTSQAGQGSEFKVSLPLNPPVNAHGELISLDFN
ncbi:MAG: hybrid sensor histidine kinase/response regulator [Deltaproteobacteria bacterium]|nr:hybrid sensor histidine kinase/response regulator [Deltaproteobacteria bacterium]